MRNTNLLLVALAILAPAASHAQFPRNNPLVEASHAIAKTGLGNETLDNGDRTSFTPTKERKFVKEFAKAVGHERSAEMEKGILTVMDVYEKSVKKAGMANDVATALAFSVDELYAYDRGEEINKDSFVALIPRFRAVLAKVDATDAQKQEFYEYALSCAGAVMTLGATAEDDAAKTRAKNIAELLMEGLTGAKPGTIFLAGPNVEIRAASAEQAAEPKSEPAPILPPASPAPSPERSGHASPVGGDVVGEWRWINTGSITNWNMSTGAYAGAGRGMTKRYVFHRDGTFTQDALIQVNTSGHASSAYITAEGRYEIHGNQIKFIAVKGHLHGEDNMISSGNYDKPMPDDTLRGVISSTLPFSVRKVDGKLAFVLHLGSDSKSDMVFTTLRK